MDGRTENKMPAAANRLQRHNDYDDISTNKRVGYTITYINRKKRDNYAAGIFWYCYK